MKSLFRMAFLFGALLSAVGAGAQIKTSGSKITWAARLEPKDARAGEQAQVVVEAKMEAGWHTYALKLVPEGPKPTEVKLLEGGGLKAAGTPVEPSPKSFYDTGFEKQIGIHEGAVALGVPVQVSVDAKGAQTAAVEVNFAACDDKTCLPPDTVKLSVAYTVTAGAARPDHTQTVTAVPAQPAGRIVEASAGAGTPPSVGATGQKSSDIGGDVDTAGKIRKAKDAGLLSYLWLSLSAGFLALLTPCVFPMIPITVSFFTKPRGAEKGGTQLGIAGPVAYCFGIIGTFTGLGMILALAFGATSIQSFATNPYVNLGLAVLFTVLAANLFGVFEIIVPSGLVNKAQAGTKKDGLLAPFLMGFTFTLTSFTCTVPFVGTLLVTATQGDKLYPLLGMLAFSSAFALPFFLLALFPQFLNRMPKSGAWLVSVKATMGFLELAAAVKFLSNADLVWQKGLLTRPIFLSVWFAIFTVCGFYLLGWLRLPHDAPGAKYGWLRRGLGVVTLLLCLTLLGAMKGNSLGELDAFVPPDPYPGQASTVAGALPWLDNYEKALAQAKAQNKPVFINFTGVTCTNCRWMEKHTFTRPDVVRELGNYVLVELYTDRTTPEDAANKALEQKLVNDVALPFYVVVTPDGSVTHSFPGLTRDPQEFVGFLQAGRRTASR